MLLSILVGCRDLPPDDSVRDFADADALVTWAHPLAGWAPTGGLTSGATGGLVLTFDVPDGGAGVPVVALLDGAWEGTVVAESALDVGLAEPIWPGAGYLASGTLDAFGRRYLAIGREDRVTLLAGPLTGWVGQESEQAELWVGEDVSPVSSGARGLITPDLTGDGAPDFVLARPAWGGGAGRVDVFEGPLAADLDVSAAWTAWEGQAGAGLGAWLGPGGDVDGDGLAEVLAADASGVWVLPGGGGEAGPLLPGATEAVPGEWTGDATGDVAALGPDGVEVRAGPGLDVVVARVGGATGGLASGRGEGGLPALWVIVDGALWGLPAGELDGEVTEAAASTLIGGIGPGVGGRSLGVVDLDGDGVDEVVVGQEGGIGVFGG